ncbi:hypothetical protein L1887_46375 [Cichorium endivia]|nr:hypothetical protein L1887_46375 [Cichorium endivia]
MTAMLFSLAVGLNTVSMAAKADAPKEQETDVLLIGGGIMSATLGTYLQELQPDWSMTMVERLDGVAQESSNGWNNAGTGHSALMELNYTPQKKDGSISIEKAVEINEAFQVSRQFWSHQVNSGVLHDPHSFINTVPHMSFVWGEQNVNFLRARYAALQQSTLFRGMKYSEDHAQIKEWAPLVMEGRDPNQKVAATRTEIGTDVNYGEITRQLVMLSDDDRFEALKEYYPQAKKEDWRLWQAGQRVQIIKRDPKEGGVLRLGTEVVSDKDGTIAALLGASPGASTAAPIMLHLMEKVFKDKVASPEWQAKLKTIIPSYGTKLNGNVSATEQELEYTSRVLQLQYIKPQAADAAPKAELKPQPENKPVADIAL